MESLLIGDNNLVLEAKAGEVIKFQPGIVRLKIMMDIQVVRILMGSLINKIIPMLWI